VAVSVIEIESTEIAEPHHSILINSLDAISCAMVDENVHVVAFTESILR
jgi:hypothetical protein